MHNLGKCLDLFDDVYVSSDSAEILDDSETAGAIPIIRPEYLCGDTPNITVYRHAIKQMKCDAFVAVQANSPNVKSALIREVKHLLYRGWHEIMTCHDNYSLYGSLWALSKDRLKNYKDPYKPRPFILIKDSSIDIHTQQDYERSLNNN